MEKTIYFDNAATTYPKPEVVYETMDNFYRGCGVNAGRSCYRLAREANKIIEQTRANLAELVNFKDPQKVVFTPSATIAMNQIIGGLQWDEGKTVYVTPFEHNAIMRPLNYIQKKYNIKIEEIPFDPITFELDTDKLKVRFSRKYPDYIFMSHVSNVTGYILPIEKIINESEKYNPVVVADCAQSIGLLPIDMQTFGADFVVFAGHKTLYGPFGVAGYIDNSKIQLKEFITGGTGLDSLSLEMPKGFPNKYEAASPNILSIAGLHSALNWINNIGIYNIREKEIRLTKILIEELKDIDGVKMYLPEDLNNHIGIVSFNLKNYKPDELGQILDQDFNIAVRTGYHCAPMIHNLINTENKCGTVRISLGYFNNNEEINYLIKCLNEI